MGGRIHFHYKVPVENLFGSSSYLSHFFRVMPQEDQTGHWLSPQPWFLVNEMREASCAWAFWFPWRRKPRGERAGIIYPGDSGGGAMLHFNKTNSLLDNAESLTKSKLSVSKTDWQKKLTPEQFHVTREKGTEAVSRMTWCWWDCLGEGTLEQRCLQTLTCTVTIWWASGSLCVRPSVSIHLKKQESFSIL